MINKLFKGEVGSWGEWTIIVDGRAAWLLYNTSSIAYKNEDDNFIVIPSFSKTSIVKQLLGKRLSRKFETSLKVRTRVGGIRRREVIKLSPQDLRNRWR